MKRTKRFAPVAALLVGLFLLAGCQDIFSPPEHSASGNGLLNLSINGTGGRTILPSSAVFSKFRLDFYVNNVLDGNLSRDLTASDSSISLPVGTYKLIVTGFINDTAIARGVKESLVINSGQTATVNIILDPYTEADGLQGTFSWDLSECSGASNISITIDVYDDNVANNETVKNDVSGSCDLAPGKYSVVFSLMKDGENLRWRSVLYIYPDLTSSYVFDPYTFSLTGPVNIVPGTYDGKDVLGNSYTLTISASGQQLGRSAFRAAAVVDENSEYEVKLTNRKGQTRTARGRVKAVSEDGTLTLEQDTGDDFVAVVDGGDSLEAIAGTDGVAEIEFDGGETLVLRSFDNIYLRANRWETADGNQRGEQLASGMSVLVKDYPTNVSKLQKGSSGRYTITVSGTVDQPMEHIQIEIQGVTEDDQWVWLGNAETFSTTAGSFEKTVNFNVGDDNVSYNLMDYKEVVLQFTEVINYYNDSNPGWNQEYGTLPGDIPNGHIMASIGDFKISLKDTLREAFKGNMPDYTYGFAEDGMTVDYRQALWSLTGANVTTAKKQGAKFEFIMTDVDLEETVPAVAFIWQDPVNGLWWQDATIIMEWDGLGADGYRLADGVEWDRYRRKLKIDLPKIIKDNRFYSATELNFIVACWWNGNAWSTPGYKGSIDELAIAGANLVNLPAVATNMYYCYGFEEDGISTQETQAMFEFWGERLEKAQVAGARLEFVFEKDLTEAGVNPSLALTWQGYSTGRYWPTEQEAGIGGVNIIICGWDVDDNSYKFKDGVTYDSDTKKLTIVLDQALETYNGFLAEQSSAAFVLTGFWGFDDIFEFGIVSANVIGETGNVTGTVTIQNGIQDETVSLDQLNNFNLPSGGNLTVTVSGSYDTYQWRIDGVIQSGTSNSLTLNGSNFTAGRTYRVLVTVWNYTDYIPYSKAITFTVGN